MIKNLTIQEDVAIEMYLAYYRMIFEDIKVEAIAPESLLDMAVVLGQMEKLIPNIEAEIEVANLAMIRIKTGRSLFLEYDCADNTIRKKSSNGRKP